MDASGNAYVAGYTRSSETTFPDGDGFEALPGPDLSFNGGLIDAFVAKVNPEGTALLYAGYIGGAGIDYGRDVAVDAAGNAYVTGETSSVQSTFPDGDGFGVLPGPDRTYNGDPTDAFVAKVNATGDGAALRRLHRWPEGRHWRRHHRRHGGQCLYHGQDIIERSQLSGQGRTGPDLQRR